MKIKLLSTITKIALILKLNSLACNFAIISIILLIIHGFREGDETFFYLASFPNFIAFPTSMLNLVVQIILRLRFIKKAVFYLLCKKFNCGSRLNKLSLILSILFLFHHMNYGIWMANVFM